jgi:MFS family permease
MSFKRAWTPLRHQMFRDVWIAALASNVGTWMQTVGASWLMTTLSVSPLMVALVQTASSLPNFLVSLPAGAIADMVDRRRMLLVTQTWMLLAAALLGFLSMAGWVGPWWLLALTFALGLGAAANGPAWQAMIPDLVPHEDLPSAVALNSVQFNIARAIGPALAGLLLAATSSGVVFLVNAVSFLGVIIVLWRQTAIPRKHPKSESRIWAALREGLRYVKESHALRSVLIRQGTFVVMASGLWSLLPVVASRELHGSALAYGILLGCLGAGAVAGAAVLAPLRASYSADWVAVTGTLLFAAATAGLAVERQFIPLAIAMFAGGIAWMTTMSTFNVFTQTSSPGWVKARALAVYLLMFQASLAIGSTIWGAVADRLSVRGSLLLSAGALVAGLAMTFRFPLIHNVVEEHAHVHHRK